MTGTPNPAAWLGVAFALVVLANYGLAQPIRLALALTILFVLLSHATAFSPALDRLNAALAGRAYKPAGSRPAR